MSSVSVTDYLQKRKTLVGGALDKVMGAEKPEGGSRPMMGAKKTLSEVASDVEENIQIEEETLDMDVQELPKTQAPRKPRAKKQTETVKPIEEEVEDALTEPAPVSQVPTIAASQGVISADDILASPLYVLGEESLVKQFIGFGLGVVKKIKLEKTDPQTYGKAYYSEKDGEDWVPVFLPEGTVFFPVLSHVYRMPRDEYDPKTNKPTGVKKEKTSATLFLVSNNPDDPFCYCVTWNEGWGQQCFQEAKDLGKVWMEPYLKPQQNSNGVKFSMMRMKKSAEVDQEDMNVLREVIENKLPYIQQHLENFSRKLAAMDVQPPEDDIPF